MRYGPHGKRALGRVARLWGEIVLCNEVEKCAVETLDRNKHSIAEPGRTLRDRIEDGLHVGRRAADDAQNLARRRLTLQRLGELAVARLHLCEQPHVLDRDDGLIAERLEQRD